MPSNNELIHLTFISHMSFVSSPNSSHSFHIYLKVCEMSEMGDERESW